ncbi:hypothetical protein [Paeniglutamicibacter psychrophenolicus]|uniref:Uncharacterized protein n=1 Tax=Paeniglutamicibacter psychrophenolicus TaxID=257454 RepID=A0ABS4WEJ7_9MICC|nr:hypothetical protein [Paeniglutamicibacter psychrophenolicus]MBP2374639.1 hypothetical protein [Paeniglutamicibacter psychrophenolicus]
MAKTADPGSAGGRARETAAGPGADPGSTRGVPAGGRDAAQTKAKV